MVVDFGAQYAQLIARRVREAGVYSEIVHHDVTPEEVKAKDPVAIILSGGPSRDRKSTRLNSSHPSRSRMPSSA